MSGDRIAAGWSDLNVHYGPDVVPRSQSAWSAVLAAEAAGLKAVCLRSHAGSSVDVARALDEATSAVFTVVGGITLNRPVGGLNPHAVEVALRTGARIVALPTWDAEAEEHSPRLREAVALLDADGNPFPGLREVLALAAEAGVCFDLGPARADQLLRLVELARAAGVERVLVSHPFYAAQRYPLELVEAAVDGGATIEHCYMQFDGRYPGRADPERLVAQIRAVGPAAVVLSSDSGKHDFPTLVGCLERFHGLLQPHFGAGELRTMFADNPAWLLGVS